MRTSFLAAFFGLSLVACTGVIGDPGPGGDDDVPGPDCGDSVINSGETCDDGNNVSGDGCSAACSVEASPALSVVVDNTAVTTELMTETMLTLTFTASGGFGGPVTLTGSAVNAANAPITGWAITFDQATVNVPLDGTATAVATVKIPSENKGLAGTVKIDAASSLGTQSATSAFTVLNQLTVQMTLTNGQCVYPDYAKNPGSSVNLTVGSKLRFKNNAAQNITIHMVGGIDGLGHQPDPGTAPGQVFEQTLGSADGTESWWCHDPGDNDVGRTIVARPAQ